MEHVFKLGKNKLEYIPNKIQHSPAKGTSAEWIYAMHPTYGGLAHREKLMMLSRSQGLVSITEINYGPWKGFSFFLHITLELSSLCRSSCLIRFHFIFKELFKIHYWFLLCFEPFVSLLHYLGFTGLCVHACVCVCARAC